MSIIDRLEAVLAKLGGVVKGGGHPYYNTGVCAIELANAAREVNLDADRIGANWMRRKPSDRPHYWPDFRSLNDCDGWLSDEQRTYWILKLLDAFWDWEDWSADQVAEVFQAVDLGIFSETSRREYAKAYSIWNRDPMRKRPLSNSLAAMPIIAQRKGTPLPVGCQALIDAVEKVFGKPEAFEVSVTEAVPVKEEVKVREPALV